MRTATTPAMIMQARITQLASEGGKHARTWPVLEQQLDHHLPMLWQISCYLNLNHNVCLNVLTHTVCAILQVSCNWILLFWLMQCHRFNIIWIYIREYTARCEESGLRPNSCLIIACISYNKYIPTLHINRNVCLHVLTQTIDTTMYFFRNVVQFP